jgi:hypothetical protein
MAWARSARAPGAGWEVHRQHGPLARVQGWPEVGVGGQGAAAVVARAGGQRGERRDHEHVAVRGGVEEPWGERLVEEQVSQPVDARADGE